MQRWKSLASILAVVAGVIGAEHFYLWLRLVRDVGFAPSWERGLTMLVGGLEERSRAGT